MLCPCFDIHRWMHSRLKNESPSWCDTDVGRFVLRDAEVKKRPTNYSNNYNNT